MKSLCPGIPVEDIEAAVLASLEDRVSGMPFPMEGVEVVENSEFTSWVSYVCMSVC